MKQNKTAWMMAGGGQNRFLVIGPKKKKKASGAPAYRWIKLLKTGLNCKCHRHNSVLYAFAAVIKKEDWRWAGWLCKIPDLKIPAALRGERSSHKLHAWILIYRRQESHNLKPPHSSHPQLQHCQVYDTLWEVMFGVRYWLLIKKVSARPGEGPNEEDNTGTGRSRVHVALHTDPTPTRGQRTRPQWSHYMPSNDGGAC